MYDDYSVHKYTGVGSPFQVGSFLGLHHANVPNFGNH